MVQDDRQPAQRRLDTAVRSLLGNDRRSAVERVDGIPTGHRGHVRGDRSVLWFNARRWMMPREIELHQEQSESQPVPGYEPPRIEVVLTAEALGREGLYAGLTPPHLTTSNGRRNDATCCLRGGEQAGGIRTIDC